MKKFFYLFELIFFIAFFIIFLFVKNKLAIFLTIPVILIILFSNKIKIKNYALFLFIFAFLERLVSIFYLKLDILDDFKTMLIASRSLIHGNFSFLHTAYFQLFSYQLGHVLYQSFLLKICNHVFFLKFINSIITSLIVIFMFFIIKKLFTKKIAFILSFSYLFYFYPLYLNSVLTNQHLPALIYLIIIYMLIHEKITIQSSTLIALLLSFANFFRTESIIFLLGILFYHFIHIRKKNAKVICKNCLVLIFVYFFVNMLISQITLHSPLKTELKNNAPYWKFYCGLSYDNNGKYNVTDEQTFFNCSNPKKLLIQRIKKDKLKFPVLFVKKEVLLWTQANYDLSIKNSIHPKFSHFFFLYNQGFLNLIILLFLISIFPYHRKVSNQNILFLKFILALYFVVYLFIEVSPRYAYILHLLIFLILGIALERISLFISKVKKFFSNHSINYLGISRKKFRS